jgi:ribosomal protein S18 acetylase RimI-like enzyme
LSGAGDITLRPSTEADLPFLQKVYAESRVAELAATDWTEEQKAAFCLSQFEAQDHFYRSHYPECEFLIIEQNRVAVGRLYRDRRSDEIRVVDIAILDSERGRGIGGRLLQDVLAEAAVDGLQVRMHVERTNAARRLYGRLGFVVEEQGDVYDLLLWKSPI